MRKTSTRTFVTEDGKVFKASIIEDPNIDDVLIAEAEVQAQGISSGVVDVSRRVDRGVREILLRFGVQRE
jgi:hypothetical protein